MMQHIMALLLMKSVEYDFRRVPRDLGDTQIHLDYSNEDIYWNNITDKAADSKKLSLKRPFKTTLKI